MKRQPTSNVKHAILGLFLRLSQAISSILIIPFSSYANSENHFEVIELRFPFIISLLTLIYLTSFSMMSVTKPSYLMPGIICILELTFFILWLVSFSILMSRGGFSSCSPLFIYFVEKQSFTGIRDDMSPCHARNATIFLVCFLPIYFMITMAWYSIKNFRAAITNDPDYYLFSMYNPRRYWLSWVCFINSPLGALDQDKEESNELLESEII